MNSSFKQMKWDKYTLEAGRVLGRTNYEAQRFNHKKIESFHVLLGILGEDRNIAAYFLRNFKADLRRARLEAENIIPAGEKIVVESLPYSEETNRCIEHARDYARKNAKDYIGTEHILLGLIKDDGTARKVLSSIGVNIAGLEKALVSSLGELQLS